MPIPGPDFFYSNGPCPNGWELAYKGTMSQGCARRKVVNPDEVNAMAQEQVAIANAQYANMAAQGAVAPGPMPTSTQPPASYAPKGFLAKTWDGWVALCGGNKYVAGAVGLGAGYYLYKKLS